MNSVAHAQLTFRMLTLLQKYVNALKLTYVLPPILSQFDSLILIDWINCLFANSWFICIKNGIHHATFPVYQNRPTQRKSRLTRTIIIPMRHGPGLSVSLSYWQHLVKVLPELLKPNLTTHILNRQCIHTQDMPTYILLFLID